MDEMKDDMKRDHVKELCKKRRTLKDKQTSVTNISSKNGELLRTKALHY